MVSNIICYKNTGFDRNNRPSSATVLEKATATTFPSVWVYQNLDQLTIRIKAEYSAIEDVDYVKIGDKYYTVTGLKMLTEQTAELALSFDPIISSGGVSAITVIGGWDERAHVSSDALFSNILEEPFVPSNRLERTAPVRLIDYGYGDAVYRFVAATVDLTQIGEYADQYYDAASQETALVSVPRVPAVKFETNIGIVRIGETDHIKYPLPVTTLYDLSNDKIREGLTKARSLGIEGAITSCYIVPIMTRVGVSYTENGVVSEFYAQQETVDLSTFTGMKYKYGGYIPKNNKAYALFNSYMILAVGSGDTREYDAHDLYHSDNAPVMQITMDVSPGGRPYLGPRYYLGDATELFQDCVSGAVWRNNPLAYTEASGSLLNTASARRKFYDVKYDEGVSAVSSVADMVANALQLNVAGAVGTAMEGAASAQKSQREASDLVLNYQTQNNVVAPTISFPVSDSLQGFLGNTFYASHTHLSDADLERFDNFLTQFGYRVDKRFTKTDLTSRKYFNYIKTTGAVVSVPKAPLRVEQMIADTLNGGVRLWHVLPNTAAMTNNPIA